MIFGDLGAIVTIETINTGSAPPAVTIPFIEAADERVPVRRHLRHTDEESPAIIPPFPLCGWNTEDDHRPRRRRQLRRVEEDRPLSPPTSTPPTPTPSVLGWIEFDQHPPHRKRSNRRTEEDTPTLLIPNPPARATLVESADERRPRRRHLRCREREQDDDGFPTMPTSTFIGYGQAGARQQFS